MVHANNHHQSIDKLHFEAEDGDLYAIPSNVQRPNPDVRNTTNLEELFDGECYASTYQTNGQCHIYQELPEVTANMPPRPRSKSMVASQEVLGRSKPAIPLRVTASSASVAKFPYTMPNTPALSVFDSSEARPSFQGFPYTESRPNTAYSELKMTAMSPYLESRPSLASSSNLELKPSVSTMMSYTPEETPVSSWTAGSTADIAIYGVPQEMVRLRAFGLCIVT